MADVGTSELDPARDALRWQQAARESDARAQAVFDAAEDGIITIDEHGRIDRVNHAVETLFGYTASELVGRNVSVLMPPAHARRHDHYIADYVRTGHARVIGAGREVVALRKDKTRFPVYLRVHEFRLGERRLFTGILRDLTERHRLEHEILAISDREKRRVGQDLHDSLGQLLTGIGFKARSLENKLLARELPDCAAAARLIAELVTQAINQAKALSRGLQPVDPEPGGLMSALQAMAAGLEKLFGVSCSLHCAEPVLLHNPTAAGHLYRIAQESANNAIKHGKARRVDISLYRDDTGLVLAVLDDGVGLPAPLPTGGGLGLHIMRYRAAMIGASLSIHAAPAGGTIVTCTVAPELPLEASHESATDQGR